MATIRKNNNDTFYINNLLYPRIFRAEVERGEVYLYNVYTNSLTEQSLGKLTDITIDGASIGSSHEVFLNKLRETIFNKGGSVGTSGTQQFQSVNTFADLPTTATTNSLYYVRQSTGAFLLGTLKRKGLYIWDGTSWQTTNLPIELIEEKEHGASVYDATKKYYAGNLIWHGGFLQRCKADINAKAFDQTDWEAIKSSSFWEALNEDTTATHIYKGGLNSSKIWQINRYEKASGFKRTKANQTNNSTVTSLASAWTNRTTLTYA